MAKNQAFNVYLENEHGEDVLIDTVFASNYDIEEMRRSLINHDGYDPAITVTLRDDSDDDAGRTRIGNTPEYSDDDLEEE